MVYMLLLNTRKNRPNENSKHFFDRVKNEQI